MFVVLAYKDKNLFFKLITENSKENNQGSIFILESRNRTGKLTQFPIVKYWHQFAGLRLPAGLCKG
jgi:hypothetical protein